MQDEELLSTPQAAELLGLKKRWIQRLIAQGRLPAQKLGRDWRVKKSDLIAYKPAPKGRRWD